MIRIIFDDGTPHCLPRWACNEIAEGRLRELHAVEALIANDAAKALRVLSPEIAAIHETMRS